MFSQITKPIIFLPIESTPRELDYKINLARHFGAAGLDIIIGNPPFIRDELKYKNYRGVFLEKGGNPDPKYYNNLVKKGLLLFCLSDEGAACPAFSVTYDPAVETLKTMETIFLWGEFQKEDLMIRNSDHVLNEKYAVSGYPGLALSLPIYRNYHKKIKRKLLTENYILVNTNFASHNGFSFEETLISCPQMSPETRKGIEEHYKKDSINFSCFYAWIKQIIEYFPNELFLIRPHPGEKKHLYESYFANYSNVVVSKEGTANQAISAAKLVIHSDCTTALQSYLMGVPVVSLAHPYIEHTHSTWALSFGMLPKTVEEAVANIKDAIKHEKWSDADQERINEQAQAEIARTFTNIESSTSTVVDTIVKAVREKWPINEPYTIKDSRTWLAKIKHQVRKRLPLHYKIDKATRETLLPFSKKDVERRLALFEEVDPLGCEFRVKKIFPNVYRIQKK